MQDFIKRNYVAKYAIHDSINDNGDKMRFGIKDFVSYCKNNILVCLTTCLSVLVVYGVKLSNISIDCDGAWYLNQEWKSNMLWWIGLGRWGIPFIKLFRGNRINYYLDTCLACMLLLLSTVLCSYLLNVVSEIKSKWATVLSAAFFIISPIWIEMNHSNFMSVEVMIGVALTPITILIFLHGIKQGSKKYTICAAILAVFAVSIYQSIWCLLLGEMSAVLLLLGDHLSKNDEEKYTSYKRLWVLSYGLLLVAGIGYFITNKIIQLIFNSSLDYVSNMINFGTREYMFLFCKFIYKIFFADFTALNAVLKVFLASLVDNTVLDKISWNTSSSSILHIPLMICFVIILIKEERKTFLCYISVAALVLSVFILGLLGGNVPGRSLYALPFVGAFLIYYIILHMNQRQVLIVAYFVVLIGIIHQVRKGSMLLYSDYRRYEWDVSTLEDIVDRVEPFIYDNGAEKQLLIVGGLKCPLKEHFLRGECLGDSLFETHTAEFLHYMGYKYTILYKNEGKEYEKYIDLMPNYPAQGCVQEVDNIIVLKLSDPNENELE